MPYTPEQENKIRRAAQAQRVAGWEAHFRSKPKPEIDVGAAVKRAVRGAVRDIDWSKRNLHPSQFPQAAQWGEEQTRRPRRSEVVRRKTVKVPAKKQPSSSRFPL